MVELTSLILIGVIILSIILLLVLLLPNTLLSKLKRKPQPTSLAREYNDKIKRINKSKIQSEIKLDQINEIAKDFFSKAFHLSQNLDYTELISEFKKRKSLEGVQFSDLMLKSYYSGQKITSQSLDKAEVLLVRIINKNSYLLEKENKKPVLRILNPIIEKLEQKAETNNTNQNPENSKTSIEQKILNEINQESRDSENLRKKAEDLLHKILRERGFENLSGSKIKKKDLHIFMKQHNNQLNNLHKYSSELSSVHKEFNLLFTKAFKNGSKFQKQRLERLSKEWKKEDKELKKVLNPFRKLLISVKIINKYAAKLKFIIIHQNIQLNHKVLR